MVSPASEPECGLSLQIIAMAPSLAHHQNRQDKHKRKAQRDESEIGSLGIGSGSCKAEEKQAPEE